MKICIAREGAQAETHRLTLAELADVEVVGLAVMRILERIERSVVA